VSALSQTLTVLKRILIVIGIAVAFTLGLLGAIYLSLRSSETRVPDIVGKDRITAENTISGAGLNFRVRATRPTSEAKPDTVLIQLPRAGEVVKVGQTVAVDISRATQDGEASTPVNSNTDNTNSQENTSANNGSNSNSKANTNANANKKPTNRNANANANRAANRNVNGNSNRAVSGNTNANSATGPTHPGTTSNPTPARPNTNVNRRPPPVTAPTP
jgi:hypothetical protein